MILPESTIIAIRSPIQRLRTLRLPVARPARKAIGVREWNQPCLLQPGGTYTLIADTQNLSGYERLLWRSDREPSRARAVVWLMQQVMRDPLSARVTVYRDGVVREGAEWVVTFDIDKDGELADAIKGDEPFYLSSTRDYTTLRDELGAGEVMLPFGEDLERVRRKARERRVSPERAGLRRSAMDAETLQQAISNMKARELVRRAQRNFEAAERLLSAEDVCSTGSAAVAGSQGEADRPPSGASFASADVESPRPSSGRPWTL